VTKVNSRIDDVNGVNDIRVVDDRIIFVPGKLDLEESGVIKNPGDISLQSSRIIAELAVCLGTVEASLSDLVKLVVYYVQFDVDEMELRLHLGRCLGTTVQTAVTFVPIRQLRIAEALVEIEAIAIRGESSREGVVHSDLAMPGAGFCHGLRCGEFAFLSGQSSDSYNASILFPDDLVSQNQKTIENLRLVMQLMDVDDTDIVKVNSWRAPTMDRLAYETAASDRFRFLAASGPAVTGITIPRLNAIGHQIRLDLWAMDTHLQRTKINPPDHWGWKIAASYSHGLQVGPWLFVGGQAALDKDCIVQYPENIVQQIDVTKCFIENIIKHATGEYKLVKLNGLFCDSTDSDQRIQIRQTLTDLFPSSRPVRTFIPVDHLAYSHQAIELDAIAKLQVNDSKIN
jgi:enamine deaminase RidA (YjgF/YER057c/UK114 family)